MSKIRIEKQEKLYLSKIHLSNFKGWKKPTEIKLSPKINLIFGKNSSGKSSIIQSLRLFRQSYGSGNLTPLNLESPTELKNTGGINIEGGYPGAISDGDLNKKMGIGVYVKGDSTGKQKKIDENLNIIDSDHYDQYGVIYNYKYLNKFYKGKGLINEKTVLESLQITNKKFKVKIHFPKTSFFKENSSEGTYINETQELLSGNYSFLRRIDNEENKHIFESAYPPYYYSTSINPNEMYDFNFEDNWKSFKKRKKEVLFAINKFVQSYEQLIKNSEEIKKAKKILKQNKHSDFYLDKQKETLEKRKELNLLLVKLKSLKNQKKISEIKKNCLTFKALFDDHVFSKRFDDLSIKEQVNFKNELKTTISFLKSSKSNNKLKFIEFFKNDLCKKFKNLIFYKGTFLAKENKKAGTSRLFLGQEDELGYKINLLSWFNYLFGGPNKSIFILNKYGNNDFRGFTQSALGNVGKVMDKVLVVPGLRALPKRYFVKGLQTNYVGPQAENLAELLANSKIRNQVNKWFKKLEIPFTVNVKPDGNYYEIVFKPKNSKMEISQMHVGLGYPIILPFVVQCLIVRNTVLVIEEPETHLHPKFEADLVDLVIDSATARNNQFIIETHSEDFLYRTLKKIREKKIYQNQVSVNYITPSKNGAKVDNIEVTSFGTYKTPWKDNLFADRRKNK